MHAKHRTPESGYRSVSMGMGGAAATSRISPEGSIRGHGLYNSEYNSYNRDFGRAQPKPFQLPQPPRRGDIFMEAGRLATEYLVSKGLLPPNVLSGKWQNGSLKNQIRDFQGFRTHEGGNLQFPPEGRTSALARLGNPAPDAGSSRRRFPDEYNRVGSRNYMRGRRNAEFFKSNGSEWNREVGRSSSVSDKARDSPGMDVNNDTLPGNQEEQQVGKDDGIGLQKSPVESPPKSDSAGDSESAPEKYQLHDAGLKASSSSIDNDLTSDVQEEPVDKSADMRISCSSTGEMKDDSCNDEVEKQSAKEDTAIQSFLEDDTAIKNGSGLLALCRFAKVPTKTRSSLRGRGSKNDPVPIDENTSEIGFPAGSGAPAEDVSLNGSTAEAPSNQNSKCLDSKTFPGEDAGELGFVNAVGQEKCMRSRSFPDKSFTSEHDSSEWPPEFGRSISMVTKRGDKRSLHLSDDGEGTKRTRTWAPAMDASADDHLLLSSQREKPQVSPAEKTSPDKVVNLAVDQKGSADTSLISKSGTEPCIEYAEEKPLFPCSFKICDLNLMEGSDVNDNQNANPIPIFPSLTDGKKEVAPVDIDLTMNSHCNTSDYSMHRADGKEVEVIDLENDSMQEDKAFNSSDRKAETIFAGLESFPDHAQSANDVQDGQDGYGLMISELLGSNIPNCSSVAPDINCLHNEMDLHNGEAILGDDDSIYMSLEEIPISFLRPWEQPTQDFEKPF